MRVVADARVVVKWAVPDPQREEHLDQALALLGDVKAGRVVLLQPPHWMAEVAAVLTRLQPAIVEDALDLLDAMELQVVNSSAVYKRASRIARDLNKHLFDTLYHAVALECEGVLVTADGSYSRKARRLGSLLPLAAWKGVPEPGHEGPGEARSAMRSGVLAGLAEIQSGAQEVSPSRSGAMAGLVEEKGRGR